MTKWNDGGRPNPCHGCPDRYYACSDHCTKDEFLKWKAEQALVRQNRRKSQELAGYISDNAKRRGHTK